MPDLGDGEVPQWQAASGLPEGDATGARFRIRQISMHSGDVLHLPTPGVTAIVGSNNSGKSTLLRQLQWHLAHPQNVANERVQLIERVTVDRIGSPSDLLAWLDAHATYRPPQPHGGGRGSFTRMGAEVALDAAINAWQQDGPQFLAPLAPMLISYADAQSRLGLVGAVGQRGDVGEPASHPLHLLQDDANLRDRLNGISQRVFRQDLTLDHLSGNMQLRVGLPTVVAPGVEEGQRAYRQALAELPPLQLQGDGMKSLLGLLLPLVTATYPVIIVDEPEAFLHPPQAYALGQTLGELASDRDLQVILATHDRNLLAGLLDSETPLSVVRLAREDDTTRAPQLPAEELRAIWSDPVLRYSNVLDGLFHRLVVLAEAERDCRFYEAALDGHAEHAELPAPPTEVLFVPSYGKAAMARLAQALVAVAVPVIASPDLDVLNDAKLLDRLVTAVGGDWSVMANDYDVATDPFRRPRDPASVAQVRDALGRLFAELLQDDPDVPYGADVREALHAELRAKDSPWGALKSYGQRAFKGQAAAAADRLLDALDRAGVVTVRVGELEGFAPIVGVGKGKEWLAAALTADAHLDVEAQNHVARLAHHLERP